MNTQEHVNITQNVHNHVWVSLTYFTTPSEAFRVNSLAPVLPTDVGELTTPEQQTQSDPGVGVQVG